MRFAASKQSLLKYHFVPPVRLPTREILRNALFNQCLLSIQRAKNEAARSSGSQRSPAYAAQKRHPCRGIKYERGDFLYFTCRKMAAGIAATTTGQKRIQHHPIVTAMESYSTSRCRHSAMPSPPPEFARPRSKHVGQTCSAPNCKSHSAHMKRPHRWQHA